MNDITMKERVVLEGEVSERRLKVALVNVGGCEGCGVAFLRALPKLTQIADVSCAYLGDKLEARADVMFISGSFCRQDEEALDFVRSLRDRADIIVALGSCATFGGIMRFARGGQEPRPEQFSYVALPVLISVDFSLPGCPPVPTAVSSLVSNLQKGNDQALNLFAQLTKTTKLSGFDLIDDVLFYGLCVGCGACELFCPTKAIHLVDGKPDLIPERCIRCGTCYVSCPAGRQNIIHRKVLRELDERLRAVTKNYMDMLGFVAHELKNPLSSAIMGLYTVKDGYLGKLSPAQKEALDSVGRSLDYFHEMIKNYLELSRAERGELKVNKQVVALRSDVVEPVIEGLKQELEKRKMVVKNNIPAELKVSADRDLLRIVYDNLLSNAVKYGKEGGDVVLDAWQNSSEVVHSVYNEGPGIPRDKMAVLFKKFGRLDNPAFIGRTGTGLGLFICKEIVEKHGGKIWVESEEGKWAKFIFTLPSETKEEK